jgi:LCP family protein required for cell wall assembly
MTTQFFRNPSARRVALWLTLAVTLILVAISPTLASTTRADALRNTETPTPTMPIIGTYVTPSTPPLIAIPAALPTPKPSGDDVVTVLMLGSDTVTAHNASRTDVMVLVSIDRTVGSVTMMQLPRDLFVYVPNYTMTKLNTVMNSGNVDGNGSATDSTAGVKLLEATLLYNFGIKVDFYAHVNFVDFENLIAKMNGLDISVDCAIQDYRLKNNGAVDYTKAENYELYTLPMGFQHLSPYMALWYVRTRASSSDFDRGRREMDVLRAIWRQAKTAGLLNQVTSLWPEAQQIVETNMTLQDILGFVPAALNLQPEKIQRIQLTLNKDFVTGPASLGTYGLIPIPDAMQTEVQNFVMPPPANRLNGETPTVEIGAWLGIKGMDQAAADRLAWNGFGSKVLGSDGMVNRANTVIYDYTGNAKPSSLQALIKLLRASAASVIEKPDPNRTVDFRVEVGRDYASCLYALPSNVSVTPQPAK